MFFVGHIAIAFLFTYFISTKLQHTKSAVSISFVMFLSVLPDVDMAPRLIGLDIGHRMVTHSAIVYMIIGLSIICFVSLKGGHLRLPVAIYLMAYLSHILLGDTAVAPINLLYPLGDFIVKSPVMVGSLYHFALEGILLATMAAVVLSKGYSYVIKKQRGDSHYKTGNGFFLFSYHRKLDGIFYPTLILAIVVSLLHLTHEFEFERLMILPQVGKETYHDKDGRDKEILILLLNLAVLTIVTLMWVTSRKTFDAKSRIDYQQKDRLCR